MKTFNLKPIAAALAVLILAGQAGASEVQPRLKDEVDILPGRTISPEDEAVLSTAAQRTLGHVSRARAAIFRKDAAQAGKELKQADALLNVIRDNAPTTVVKERIVGADGQVRYENSEESGPAVIPIFATLGEQADFAREKLPVDKHAAGNPAKATPHPASKARTEMEAEDSLLYYEEMDLPIHATQHWVAAARAALDKKHFGDADAALRAIQDNVDFFGVYLPEPLVTAKINLERAHAHYSSGQAAEAQADLGRAIEQLKAAEKGADPDSKADASKLLTDAEALKKRMDGGEAGLSGELKQVWHHTEALADRAVESTRVGWARLRNHGALRNNLIEAKRFVAYADIDANVAGDPGRARIDLERAKGFLAKAERDASGKSGAGVAVKDASAMLETLLSGQGRVDPVAAGNLKNLLGQTIHAL